MVILGRFSITPSESMSGRSRLYHASSIMPIMPHQTVAVTSAFSSDGGGDPARRRPLLRGGSDRVNNRRTAATGADALIFFHHRFTPDALGLRRGRFCLGEREERGI